MSETLAQLKEKPHYSYSALNTYLNICGLQYRFRYIDRLEPEQTPVALPFGSAFHAALSEQAHAARKGNLIPAAELTDVFAAYFRASLEESPNVIFKEDENEDSLLRLAEGMLATATGQWPDFHQTIAEVSTPFSFTVEGLTRPVIGEYDLVVREPTPFDEPDEASKVTIVDWKSSARLWPDDRADKEIQATIYIASYEASHGVRPDFRYDVVTKAKTPKVGRFYTSRPDERIARMKALLLAADKAIQAGVFLPNETSFACRDCPYAGACQSWHCPVSKQNPSTAADAA